MKSDKARKGDADVFKEALQLSPFARIVMR